MMPYADARHHCSSQGTQTSGTPQGGQLGNADAWGGRRPARRTALRGSVTRATPETGEARKPGDQGARRELVMPSGIAPVAPVAERKDHGQGPERRALSRAAPPASRAPTLERRRLCQPSGPDGESPGRRPGPISARRIFQYETRERKMGFGRPRPCSHSMPNVSSSTRQVAPPGFISSSNTVLTRSMKVAASIAPKRVAIARSVLSASAI